MQFTQEQILLLIGAAAAVALLFQVVLAIATLFFLRAAGKERSALEHEIFGLVKKLEGLTASKREQILKHYDSMLETLSMRLPPAVAAQTSKMVIETESRILNRLAELEPTFKSDKESLKKMDDLIKNMESLEDTIVATASDAVRSVMMDSRRALFDDEDMNIANVA